MEQPERIIRNISDTARWVAVYRANETEREDAVFRDPFARKLAGDRGVKIADHMWRRASETWPFVARTYVYDQLIMQEIARGCDLVVNLAAGLDARPYRMALPPALQWVEVDLPGILDEKEALLQDDKPVCRLERIRLDLADEAARRPVFEELGRRGKRVLIVTEGLVIYLSPEQVGTLATDLARQPTFRHWIFEVTSPGLLKMMMKRFGTRLEEAGAPFKFAPPEEVEFFRPFGWRPTEVHSMIKVAGKLGRLPFFLKLMSLLPERPGPKGSQPWSGIVLAENTKGS